MQLSALYARLSALQLTSRGVGFAFGGHRVEVLVDGRPAGLEFELLPVRVDALENLVVDGRLVSVTVPTELLAADPGRPSVLLAWSTVEGRGVWSLRDPLVAVLDAREPAWRSSPTVQTGLSVFDGTRDEGLERLLLAVGRSSVDRALEGHDRVIAEGLREFICHGRSIELARETHDALGLPPWFVRAFGAVAPGAPDGPVRYENNPARPWRVRLEILGALGVYSLPNIEYRALHRGVCSATLVSTSADPGLRCELAIDYDSRVLRPSVTIDPGLHRAGELFTLLRLSRALEAGGRVSVLPLDTSDGAVALLGIVERVERPSVDRETFELASALATVEATTNTSLSWNASKPLDPADREALRLLLQVIATGRFEHRQERITLELTVALALALCDSARGQQRVRVTLPAAPHAVVLLGTAIALGLRTRELTGTLEAPLAELQQRLVDKAPGEVVTVDLEDIDRRDFFSEWPKATR